MPNSSIETFRGEIRNCDNELLKILKKRFKLCLKIKKIKDRMSLPTKQQSVEDQLRLFWLSQEDDILSSDFLEKLLDVILDQSRKLQDS